MFHLLVDTSTWLDLAKRRDGQKWIVTVRWLVRKNQLRLLVPEIVVDEFERNRPHVEQTMTSSLSDRFKQMRRDLDDYGSEDVADAIELLDGLAHQVPLIGAMAIRNFEDVTVLLRSCSPTTASDEVRARVVLRALEKRAPFHRNKNSVADAMLIEIYAASVATVDPETDPHAFITSNSNDFSAVRGDHRQPHEDFAATFGAGSVYGLGVDGLDRILRRWFGVDYVEFLEEMDWREDPRRLDEIQQAESDLFDRIWYDRSLLHEFELEQAGDRAAVERLLAIAAAGRSRVEEKFGGANNLGPYSQFEWGMLNGKLSALRWVLGSEWDFLDT